MKPTLKHGDYVLVKQSKKLDIGDIAVFKQNSMTLVKRIIDMLGDHYILSGDNSICSSHKVSKESIIGKAIIKA